MKIINKILRVIVYISLIILLLFLGNFLFIDIIYGATIYEAITTYLGFLFISLLLILCIFILNKKSKKRYNVTLLIIGIFIIVRRYIFFLDRTMVKSVIYDIIPLLLVYFSAICNYWVCKKQK